MGTWDKIGPTLPSCCSSSLQSSAGDGTTNRPIQINSFLLRLLPSQAAMCWFYYPLLQPLREWSVTSRWKPWEVSEYMITCSTHGWPVNARLMLQLNPWLLLIHIKPFAKITTKPQNYTRPCVKMADDFMFVLKLTNIIGLNTSHILKKAGAKQNWPAVKTFPVRKSKRCTIKTSKHYSSHDSKQWMQQHTLQKQYLNIMLAIGVYSTESTEEQRSNIVWDQSSKCKVTWGSNYTSLIKQKWRHSCTNVLLRLVRF